MYDTTAEQRLFRKIETEARPLKRYPWGTGEILVGSTGRVWIVPNGDYLSLVDALGLAGDPIRHLSDTEKQFVEQLLATLGPAPTNVVELSEADAAKLAQKISSNVADQVRAIVAAAPLADLDAIKAAVADELAARLAG